MTTEEKLKVIARNYQIDINDWYGKFLVLQILLTDMGKTEADKFMNDTFDVLEDEIEALFEEKVA